LEGFFDGPDPRLVLSVKRLTVLVQHIGDCLAPFLLGVSQLLEPGGSRHCGSFRESCQTSFTSRGSVTSSPPHPDSSKAPRQAKNAAIAKFFLPPFFQEFVGLSSV